MTGVTGAFIVVGCVAMFAAGDVAYVVDNCVVDVPADGVVVVAVVVVVIVVTYIVSCGVAVRIYIDRVIGVAVDVDIVVVIAGVPSVGGVDGVVDVVGVFMCVGDVVG